MTPLLAAIAELAPSLLNAVTPRDSEDTSTVPAQAPPADSKPSALDLHPLALPVAPSPIPTTLSSLRTPGVNVPFQVLVQDLVGSETNETKYTIADLPLVKALFTFYRDATLISLEAVIYPHAYSLTRACTVDLGWCPANVDLGAEVINAPGGVRFTVGGLSIAQNGILPCDLKYMNPIIKSPLTYNNHPRICMKFYPVSGYKLNDPKLASIIVRGVIHLSHPTIYTTAK